jgi:hypothetical protein
MGGPRSAYGERICVCRDLMEKTEQSDYLEDTGLDEMILIRWIFMKWDVRAWTGSIWFRIGTSRGNL